jgi:hypothetical protein
MKQLILLLTALIVAGCATTPKPRVEEAHVWRNANGLELLSDGPKCHQMIRLNSQSNANEWVSVPCVAVVISHDPADEMFWTFKAHPEQKVQVGILYGIIPGSMGAKSFIVRGLGNPESFESCSHGAGRRMSRGAAKRAFTIGDVRAQTAGVECRKDAGIIDELPGAYKDIDAVMAAQRDLVEVVATLKALGSVKG